MKGSLCRCRSWHSIHKNREKQHDVAARLGGRRETKKCSFRERQKFQDLLTKTTKTSITQATHQGFPRSHSESLTFSQDWSVSYGEAIPIKIIFIRSNYLDYTQWWTGSDWHCTSKQAASQGRCEQPQMGEKKNHYSHYSSLKRSSESRDSPAGPNRQGQSQKQTFCKAVPLSWGLPSSVEGQSRIKSDLRTFIWHLAT